MSNILTTLGKNIKHCRARLEWTQEDLAKQAGVNRSYLAGIETGRRNTSARTIEKLARALGVSPADLLKSSDISQNENRLY